MDIEAAKSIAETGFQVWFWALAAVVFFGILSGKISTSGMLTTAEAGGVDPEWVLVLVVTLFGAAWYVSLAMEPGATDCILPNNKNGHCLPDVPEQLLFLLGGSQSAYITAKIFRNNKGVT